MVVLIVVVVLFSIRERRTACSARRGSLPTRRSSDLDTRSRLLHTALTLFAKRGVEATSLQMIADELGVTKAAIYYHYTTKSEIVEALVAPLLAEVNPVVRAAGARRGPGAQIDHTLAG